jgi:hypothetical protein
VNSYYSKNEKVSVKSGYGIDAESFGLLIGKDCHGMKDCRQWSVKILKVTGKHKVLITAVLKKSDMSGIP